MALTGAHDYRDDEPADESDDTTLIVLCDVLTSVSSIAVPQRQQHTLLNCVVFQSVAAAAPHCRSGILSLPPFICNSFVHNPVYSFREIILKPNC